jgi:transcriptional regulator with XRE-family HTH domain
MAKFTQIGSRIKELRGLKSQASFAREIGVSLQGYLNYEYGKRVPPGPVLAKIAEIGHATTDWILTGSEAGAGSDRTDGKLLERAVPSGSIEITMTFQKKPGRRMVQIMKKLINDLQDMDVRDGKNLLKSIEEKKQAAAYRREMKLKGR